MLKAVFIGLVCLFAAIACQSASEDREEKVQPEKIDHTAVVEPTANSLGKRMFILCEACHSLKKGEANKVGPNLHQIFGRKAAIGDGFVYSEALKSSDIIWDESNMRKWIQNPSEFIPGSNMAFVGVHKEDQQDALIEYLRVETK